jgi:hypothetical protein
MAIAARDLRLLFQQSGNRCAFPSCTKRLTFPASSKDSTVSFSEVAHIVGESADGPRGDHPMPLEERNRYENLILLCEEHHHLVDSQVATYPVEKLRQMKYAHEALIAEATRRAVVARAGDQAAVPQITERLFSSLLPVERLPKYVFSVECEYSERDKSEVQKRLVRTEKPQAAPFLLRGGRLYCFQNLRDEPGPFVDLARGLPVERAESQEWWTDEAHRSWYVSLLNRTLNKVTGWRGLNLDKDHNRYYFQPDEPGKPKSIPYKPMNQSTSELQVVWQPITKKTGLPKKFWYHRAIALSFVQVGKRSWCLAMRPEMRVTRDSIQSIEARQIGGKVTKKKAKMWNIDVLEELNFWRAFFFEERPRLIIPFGDFTALAVSANFLSEKVTWPGVPPERAKQFKNAVVEENLFDLAALDQIDDEVDELDVVEEDWDEKQ